MNFKREPGAMDYGPSRDCNLFCIYVKKYTKRKTHIGGRGILNVPCQLKELKVFIMLVYNLLKVKHNIIVLKKKLRDV